MPYQQFVPKKRLSGSHDVGGAPVRKFRMAGGLGQKPAKPQEPFNRSLMVRQRCRCGMVQQVVVFSSAKG